MAACRIGPGLGRVLEVLDTTRRKFYVARIASRVRRRADMAEAALNKVWREALGPAEVDAAMAETEAATSSAEPAATSSAEPAAPSLPPPPGTNCQNLIKAALTDEPMLPEAVHAAMVGNTKANRAEWERLGAAGADDEPYKGRRHLADMVDVLMGLPDDA